MSNIQELREDDYLEDIDTDLEHGTQENEMDSEESETNERDQIENPTKLNMCNIKELSEDEDLEDTDTDLEHGPVHDTKEADKMINKNLTIVITENRQDKKVNDEKIDSNSAVEAQPELEYLTIIDI